jgi:hypothetical protein
MYMNGVHHSGSKGGRAILLGVFLFMAEGLSAAELSIWTEPKPAMLFAGENKSVRLYVKNSANAARKINMESRTYQIATAVAAPLGERKKWKEISIEPGQTIVEKFPITLPAIRTTTTFVLKFYEQDNVVEVGSVQLLVYPEDLLSDLAQFSKTNQLAILDEENYLGTAISKTDYNVTRAKSLEERVQSDKPVVLIVVAEKGSDFGRAAEDLSKWTAGVIWVRRPSALNLDELPIEVSKKGEATLVTIDRVLLEDFQESPPAQMNLLRCLRRVLQGKPTEN